jgi:hypothetical protein
MLGVPWQDYVKSKSCPNVSLCMTWWMHGACIPRRKSKIHRWGVQYLITSTRWCSCLSIQMRPLMISKHVGMKWWWRVLITYDSMSLGQNTLGLIIANSISNLNLSQVWHVFRPFCYGCITSCMLTFHTYLNYIMGWNYVVHVHAKFWMVGLCRMLHLNQNTQVTIKSYHGALKRWFSLETKGLRGHHIN